MYKKKYEKISGGGGGGVGVDFFSALTQKKNNWYTFLSHFIYNIKQNLLGYIEKYTFTYWLNGRWFLQIVDRDSVNQYPIYPLFPCSDFFIYW